MVVQLLVSVLEARLRVQFARLRDVRGEQLLQLRLVHAVQAVQIDILATRVGGCG